MNKQVKAPFPYFGGKSMVADEIWQRLGDVPNYVEPFFGSGAVLLSRPRMSGIETINDKDGFVSNFWRAVKVAPDAVAEHADWPVLENDLHARHAWLVGQRESLTERLEGDPDYYDAKIAGWWVWGLSAWIGSGWCSGEGPWHAVDGNLILTDERKGGGWKQLPHLGDAGTGIHRQRPHLGDAGTGIKRQRPVLDRGGRGFGRQSENSASYFDLLSERLRRVRVCSGDWSRIVGPSVTTKNGLTGVFLDPPYSAEADRDSNLYTVDCLEVANDVREWAIANGDNPLMRIAVAGYDGEHDFPSTWEKLVWKGRGGFGNQSNKQGRDNSRRERIWFSPHCLSANTPTLF